MRYVALFFSTPQWGHVVWAQVHTLWQGAVLAMLLAGVLRVVPARQTNLRYVAACAALLTLLLCAGINIAVLDAMSESPAVVRGDAPGFESPQARHAAFVTGVAGPGDAWSAPRPPVDWFTWLAPLWLAGVLVMLGRALRLQMQATRLARDASVVHEGTFVDLTKALRDAMGIRRRITVMMSDRINVPATVGVLAPIVLLPASVLAGIPEDALRAALAHELAHIRRFDYFVNLMQLLIESLLFFNPAVWWISRQIRVEREACADALAARATGSAVGYAQALTAWVATVVEATSAPAAVQALSRTASGSPVDRVRRLLVPGYRPGFCRSTLSALCATGVAMLVLAMVSGGGFLAGTALGQALSDAERIERVQAVAQQYREQDLPLEEGEPMELLVRVEVVDGTPVTELTSLMGVMQFRNSSTIGSLGGGRCGQGPLAYAPGVYPISVPEGARFQFGVTAKGLAPAFSGTLKATRALSEYITLVMEEGFPFLVRVVDPEGVPVAGAEVNGMYSLDDGYSALLSLQEVMQTDETGAVVAEHCAEVPVRFTVTCPGYATTHATLTPHPDIVGEIVVQPSALLTGTVVDGATGRPVEAATLRRICGPDLKDLAATDAHGQFALDGLSAGDAFEAVFMAPDGRTAFQLLRAGTDVRVSLQPPIHIKGVLRGDTQRLERDGGKPGFRYGYCTRKGSAEYHGIGRGWATVEVQGEGATFAIAGLWPGQFEMYLADRIIALQLDESVDDFEYNIAPERTAQQRELVVLFPGTEAAPPEGTIQIDHKPVPIVNGEVRTIVNVPTWLTISCDGTVGYWFQEVSERYDAGDGPIVVDVDAVPAGAIVGKVFDHDGQPAQGLLVSVFEVEASPMKPDGWLGVDPKNGASPTDGINRFVASPLPLEGTYRILVHRGYATILSDPISLTAANPTAEIRMVLPEGMTVRGRILTPEGEPFDDVLWGFSFSTLQHGWSNMPQAEAPGGVLEIHHFNPAAEGTYTIRLVPQHTYRAQDIPIIDPFTPLDIRLQPGLRLEGTVTDMETGEPVSGVDITARPLSLDHSHAEVSAASDADGAFAFTNLAPGEYYLNAPRLRSGSVRATAGQQEPVALQVEPRE